MSVVSGQWSVGGKAKNQGIQLANRLSPGDDYDHLQLARAISAYFVDIQERLGGRDDPRLVPLLACIIELLPWLKQWHHDLDPDYNQRMDEVFEGFVTEEAKNLGMTMEEIKAWEPAKKTGRKKGK